MSRTTLKFDTSKMTDSIAFLDHLGGDVKGAVTNALEQAAETIEEDTIDALSDRNLPAKGRYSHGKTEKSVVKRPKVEWIGEFASVDVGFDYSKQGAGGYLITGYYYRTSKGTPKQMNYDKPLHKMYKGKKYMTNLTADMIAVIFDAIKKASKD